MMRLLLAWVLLSPLAVRSSVLVAQSSLKERRIVAIKWTKEPVVQGQLDSELLRPELLAARDSVVIVYDYGDNAVKAFGAGGVVLWRFGRAGRGPGEFVNPTDLQVDQDGLVWLTDPPVSRVTILNAQGRLLRSIQMATAVERVLPLSDGKFLGFAHAGGKPSFTRFNASGKVEGVVRHPAWLDTVPSLVSELRMTASPDGRSIGVGSYYSGRLLVMDSKATMLKPVAAVESYDFPKPIEYAPSKQMTVRRLPPDARPTIRSVTADAQFLYSLVYGRSDQRGRIVDMYRLADGAYHGSMILPQSVSSIAVTERGFAALSIDPLPSLYYLRFVSTP